MLVKKGLLGLAIFIALSSNSHADTSDLQSFFSDSGAFANVTSPQEFRGQTMNTYAGGGMSLRVPTRNYQIANFAPPNLKVGCGGIDIFAGSFSFINADQLVNLFQNIGNNAKGAIFSLAIKQISPQLGGVMDYIQDVAQKMNALNVNSCQAAEGLISAALPDSMRKSEDKTLKTYGANVSGLIDDFTDGFTKIDNNINKRKEVRDAINGSTNPLDDKYKKINHNVVWSALSKASKNGTTVDDMTKRMAMSLFGTVICNKAATANDPYVCSYQAPTITVKELVNGNNSTKLQFKGGRCSGNPTTVDDAAPSKCVSSSYETLTPWTVRVGSANAEVVNAKEMVSFYLEKIRDMIEKRGGNINDISTLPEDVKAGFSIIKNSYIPVWMLLKSGGVGGVGRPLLEMGSAMIASDVIYNMIIAYGRMTNMAIDTYALNDTVNPEVIAQLEKLRESIKKVQDDAYAVRKSMEGSPLEILQFAQHANDNIEREKAMVSRELFNRK